MNSRSAAVPDVWAVIEYGLGLGVWFQGLRVGNWHCTFGRDQDQCTPAGGALQGYLAHKKRPSPQDHHMTLGTGIP